MTNRVKVDTARHILKECGYSTNIQYRVIARKANGHLQTYINLWGVPLPLFILNVFRNFNINYIYLDNGNYDLLPTENYSEEYVNKRIKELK